MNFFQHQDKARKKTKVLVFYFILAVILIIVAVNVIAFFALTLSETNNGVPIVYDYAYTIVITIVCLVTMTLGTLWRMFTLRGGGVSVAKLSGANPFPIDKLSFEEKRFLNVVEEMSIASGVAMPKLYILEDKAINAFVAGVRSHDTVMVVTRGALKAFNRAELQAVIGHEFSHIFNGDMRMNVKLIGILGGIVIIGQLGHMMLSSRRGYSSRRNSNGQGVVLIGLGLFLVGYIGLFCARMIKAAISRQRELLADASSVQFTRYPDGLVSAFKTMLVHQEGTKLQSEHAEDISHFCFGPAMGFFFDSLFATHPNLAFRIKAIDPDGRIARLPRDKSVEATSKQKPQTKSPFGGMAAVVGAMTLGHADIEQNIALPKDEHLLYATAIHSLLGETLCNAARDPKQIPALLFALFSTDSGSLASNGSFIPKRYDDLKVQIAQLYESTSKLPANARLPLLEIALPAYSTIPQQERMELYNHIRIEVSKTKADPFHFALLILLKKHATEKKKQTPIRNLNAVVEQVALLLALLSGYSHIDDKNKLLCYQKSLLSITSKQVPFPKEALTTFDAFERVVEILDNLVPLCKEQVIHACIACVTFDSIIYVQEAELLRAICEGLGCPIPPIIAKADISESFQ